MITTSRSRERLREYIDPSILVGVRQRAIVVDLTPQKRSVQPRRGAKGSGDRGLRTPVAYQTRVLLAGWRPSWSAAGCKDDEARAVGVHDEDSQIHNSTPTAA